MRLKATSSASFSRLVWIATNSRGGAGMRRSRISRTTARMRFSLTQNRAAISETDTPRLR